MKKVSSGFLILIFCLNLFLVSLGGQETGRIVRVGYFDYDGFTMPDRNGSMTGYACDYLEEISSYTGWTYEYIPGTVEECLDWLATGEIDMVAGIQYTEERGKIYGYPQYEMGSEYAMLLVSEDNRTVHYNDYVAFNGLRIGFIRKTYQSGIMDQYAKERGFSYESFWYDTAAEQTAALDNGEVDAILIGSLQRNDNLKVVAKFWPMPFYFITGKDDKAFLDQLNHAMENVQTGDINYDVKLYNKYYGESFARQVAFTEEESAYIDTHPTLRVAYNETWNPIVFYNDEKGESDGISTGILQLLSERSGINFEFVRAASEVEAAEMMERKEADVLCGFPYQYAAKGRELNMFLTKPYYEVPAVLAAPSGAYAKEITKIAVPRNTLSLLWYIRDLYPDIEILPMEHTDACVQAVRVGKADAIFENSYVLDQYYKEHGALDPEPLMSTKLSIPISMGISMDSDPALRTLLNKVISQLSLEEINEIIVKNTMEGPHINSWVIVKNYALPMVAALFFIIVCVVLRSKQKIEQYAFKDPLTGYANKTRFMLSAQKLLWNRDPSAYVAVSLDIDKFKRINNMHGFDVGNRILKEISEVVGRDMTTAELFCRETDDRFDMLLHHRTGEMTERRISKMIDTITELPQLIGGSFQYTISCGVYALKKTDKDIYSAIEWANIARENAKGHRQNWVSWYDDSMRLKIMQEQDIENRMEAALYEREFQVYYQPKIRLKDEKIAGAEALVRWKQKDGTMLYPDQFIPVFESNSFILKLDLYMFEQVCIQMCKWIDEGFEPVPVSVNLSRVHLSEPNFHLKYTEILGGYKVPPNLLEIELTESTIFENITQMNVVVNAFKAAGLKVSVDDFGSGYSSLNLLKDLSFDYLKLDKEFLNTASVTERGKKVICGTKFLADQLDMTLLAEGVETLPQVEFLRSIGCDLVQGYYFAKPMPLEAFERYTGWR